MDIDMETQTLPNPLEITFGDGRIGIRQFKDRCGKQGLILTDTFSPHIVGSRDGRPEDDHRPQEGEVYLSFANQQSLQVVIDELQALLTSNLKD